MTASDTRIPAVPQNTEKDFSSPEPEISNKSWEGRPQGMIRGTTRLFSRPSGLEPGSPNMISLKNPPEILGENFVDNNLNNFEA